MCDANELKIISNALANEAAHMLADKLHSVVLFGSYARGDFDGESDIDIMIVVNCSSAELSEYKKRFIKIAGRLSLEHNVEVSVTLVQKSNYDKYKGVLPFYENVENEGVRIA